MEMNPHSADLSPEAFARHEVAGAMALHRHWRNDQFGPGPLGILYRARVYSDVWCRIQLNIGNIRTAIEFATISTELIHSGMRMLQRRRGADA